MPRGKNTNVYLSCQNKVTDRKHGGDTCRMQNYKTRINKRTLGTKKLEMNKFCPKCNDHTPHMSGSEIKHSS